MNETQWRQELAKVVRAGLLSPEFERFFAVRLNPERAKISLTQLGLFIRHRRDCWAWLSGNCPEMSVKKKILSHEYDEMVQDQYSQFGHLELVLVEFGSGHEERILDAARESMELYGLFCYGVALAMETV
jgi:hypothetical protein